jgi:hypothetical protein
MPGECSTATQPEFPEGSLSVKQNICSSSQTHNVE